MPKVVSTEEKLENAPVKKRPQAKPKKKPVALPAKYPEVKPVLYLGKDSWGVNEWKEALGWQEETEDNPFGQDYLLLDSRGKKIRCTKNCHNRPLTSRNFKGIAHQILDSLWADSRNGQPDPVTGDEPTINGESVVIGRHGNLISGQHRGIGCVWAHQLWEDAPKDHPWRNRWSKGPTMELLVVYGVDESQRTTRTIDTGKPRSFGDVLFADGRFSGQSKLSAGDRKALVRITDYAVRNLCARVRQDADAHSPYRNHAESMDFFLQHSKLEEAVFHLYTEQNGDSVKRYAPLGQAAALLYLMGASGPNTNREDYLVAPSEQRIDWSLWDRACEFWALLSSGGVLTQPVRDAIARLGSHDGLAQATTTEKEVVLIKAWNLFKLGQRAAAKVTADDVMPEYTAPDGDGYRALKNVPLIGGIDGGNPDLKEKPSRTKEDEDEEGMPPTLELYTEVDHQENDCSHDAESHTDTLEEDENDHDDEEDKKDPPAPTLSELAERAQEVIRERERREQEEFLRKRKAHARGR